MQNPMNVNTNVYKLSGTTSSTAATLVQEDINQTRCIIRNDGTTDAFIVSGATSPTAVFPTSATAPLKGSVVGGGETQVFYKAPTHGYIAAIMSSGTANITIKIGNGE